KQLKTPVLKRAAEIAIRGGLNLGAFLVIGFPEDTAEDLDQTVGLARYLGRLGLSDVACAFFFPVPATPLFEQLRASGRIRIDDENLMAPIFAHGKWLPERFNYSQNLSAARLTWYKYKITAAFYTSLWTQHPGRPGQGAWFVAFGRGGLEARGGADRGQEATQAEPALQPSRVSAAPARRPGIAW